METKTRTGINSFDEAGDAEDGVDYMADARKEHGLLMKIVRAVEGLAERVERLEESERELRGRTEALRLLLVKTKDFENG